MSASLCRYGAGVAAAKTPAVELEIGEHTVRVTNPDKVYFPAREETKLDLVQYYLSVGDGITKALWQRPTHLQRFPEGWAARRSTRSGSRSTPPTGSIPCK